MGRLFINKTGHYKLAQRNPFCHIQIFVLFIKMISRLFPNSSLTVDLKLSLLPILFNSSPISITHKSPLTWLVAPRRVSPLQGVPRQKYPYVRRCTCCARQSSRSCCPCGSRRSKRKRGCTRTIPSTTGRDHCLISLISLSCRCWRHSRPGCSHR